MSQFGEVYVELDASVVNNSISTLSISGDIGEDVEGGESVITVWLLWTYDEVTGNGGFTNLDWYFYETPLSSNFENENVFKNYLVEHKPKELDAYLGSWDKNEKITFIENNPRLKMSCVDFR